MQGKQIQGRQGFLRLCCFVLLGIVSATFLRADEAVGLRFIKRVNSYSDAGYSAIWGYTGPDGREYALLGVQSGTSIVDITDEAAIQEAAFIPGEHSIWRELKTFGHYAYVVTDSVSTGIQIIDLSQLPKKATLVATYSDLPQSHTLWIDEKAAILFTMGGTGDKVVALSLADPLHPKEIVRFGSTYVHDAYFRDGRAYLNEILSKSFSIWDISDLKTPRLLKRVRVADAPEVSFHNSWLTEDSKYLITTEETSGRTVKIWDIQNLNQIRKVAEYLPPNGLAHNIHVKGRYGYLSSYGGGIRVLDLIDPLHPKEVAYWNRNDGKEPEFVSVWGVFPFFKSGKVIGSDMEEGLIITHFASGQE